MNFGESFSPRAHLELCHAQSSRFLASLVIDLAERFHVIGNERHRHDANFPHLLSREIVQRAVQRRLQPFAGSDLALVAEPVTIRAIRRAPSEDVTVSSMCR